MLPKVFRMKTSLIISTLALVCAAQAQMVAPPKELKALEPLIGTFSGTMKTTMGDMSVVMTSEWAEGGMFLKTVNQMKVGEMSMTETMYTWWDSKAKKFKANAYQNMVPTPRTEAGEIKGNTLVMFSEPWEMMGLTYTSKATLIMHSTDEIEFSIDFKMDDKWTPQGGGKLKRVKKGAWCASATQGTKSKGSP